MMISCMHICRLACNRNCVWGIPNDWSLARPLLPFFVCGHARLTHTGTSKIFVLNMASGSEADECRRRVNSGVVKVNKSTDFIRAL